jgi:molybdate transport system substrate-binding protein
VRANVISEEANVRQLATKILLGEADAGVVYRTDVSPVIADQVRTVEIPAALNVTARYPLAVLEDAPAPAAAAALRDFILSERGQAILAGWGFGPPGAGG